MPQKYLLGCIVLLLSATAAFALDTSPFPDPRAPITAEELAPVKAAILDALFDPDSARFDHYWGTRLGKGIAVCGVVNAENQFGGYAGPTPFVAFGTDVEIYHEGMNSDAWDQYFHMLCLSSPAQALPNF